MVFRKLNKKGDVRTIAPVELVGYILGGIIVIFILLVIAAFTVFYFSEKDQEFAVNNFIALSNMVETLSKSREQFDTQRAFPFYLPSNFVIVGFNKEWDSNKKSDGCEPEPVRKPSIIDGQEGKKCENSACLCLFTNNDDFTVDNLGKEYNVNLIQCHPIEKADYIIAPYLDETNGEKYQYPADIWKNIAGERIDLSDYSSIGFRDYAFSYIYGQCEDFYWDRDVQTGKLYIEKFTDDKGINYIFIAPENDKLTEERYKAMIEKYGKLAKADYIEKIKGVLEKEASATSNFNERVSAINSFVKLINYYGFVEEIKPYLTRIAVLYLRHPSDFREKLGPIIQALEVLESGAEKEEKIKAQFFASRLYYMKSTVNGARKAILEMQELIQNNKEDYKRYLGMKDEKDIISPCTIYDQKIRENEISSLKELFLCANHLLNLTYDVEHMLIYASESEEFIISNYKIRIIKINPAKEATISIYKYDKNKGIYELVKCSGKDELTIQPKNSNVQADEYNKDISYEYSLKNLLEKCAKTAQ